jgi:radical SAM protein with 4Fe4S-binding SPASM domain
VFRDLRAVDDYHGKCHACQYRKVCGGCRARAYALTGDALADDPICPYMPMG